MLQEIKQNKLQKTGITHTTSIKKRFFPKHFQIQTTDSCNGRCITCPNSYKKKNKTNYMSDKTFKKIINEINTAPYKDRIVTLMLQNEPFLDHKLIERIKLVKRNNNTWVDTVTNGSLLNKKIIKKLEQSGINRLVISIDSINKKTFNLIRPGLDFNHVMQNIELLKQSSLKEKVKIKMVLQKNNYTEVKEFVNFCLTKGLKPEICPLTNRCGALKTFETIKIGEQNLIKELNPFYKRYPLFMNICMEPFFKMNILVNGEVIQCCHDWRHDNIFGNVKEQTIQEIWRSNGSKTFRLTHLRKETDKLNCKNCSFVSNQRL